MKVDLCLVLTCQLLLISLASMMDDLVLKLCPKTTITLLVKSENHRKFSFFKEIQVFYRKILVGIAKIRDGQIY